MICRLVLALALCSANAHADRPDDSLRVEISLEHRQLWVLAPTGDTIFAAPIAVGSGRTLSSDARQWTFLTPTGSTTVKVKERDPVWIPPDWHYVELARARDLRLRPLARSDSIPIGDSTLLVVRGAEVGLLRSAQFTALPPNEEIAFDGTLFIPPFGTRQRMVAGELGAFRLILANGVGLHGTPYKESIGKAATHGCIRLHDADIAWLFENVPVGTPVRIY